MPIILICFACVIAIVFYWGNGRTIFESHTKPSEKDRQAINEILAFEQQKLSECRELLLLYDDSAKELGVEIIPVLRQTRAVNHQGLVEAHDWNNEYWLPQYYSSQIICQVYKDGGKLERRTSNNSVSYFVHIFWLVNARKDDNVVSYNENPFNNSYTSFDSSIENLLKQASDYLHV